MPSYTEILVKNNNKQNLLPLKGEKQLKREFKETQKIFKVNYIMDEENNKGKNKIFNIAKILKKGRYKINSGKKGTHNKFNRDNIIRRFKVHIMNSILKYINKSFSINNSGYKSKINIIKKIASSDIKSISKEDNIKWLNSKVEDIFSKKITSKIVS